MENNDRGRIGQATRDVKDYAALYADRLRLGLIENLSTFFNALFGVVVLIVLLWIAAMFFAVALTWVIGMLIGSMLGAILLMGGLFVVLAAIVYAVRRRLIVDQMARMFGAGEHGGADVEAGHVIAQPRKGAGEGAASAAELRPPAALDAEAAQPPI